MNLPFFLSISPEPWEPTEFDRALQRYKDHFGKLDFNTINTSFTDEEWIAIIDYCVENDKHYTDVFGPYDKNALY